jgi:hypothetical protein
MNDMSIYIYIYIYIYVLVLFATRNLFIPLGDDFCLDTDAEISAQFTNYAPLLQYINSHPELHTEIKWATLSEYFFIFIFMMVTPLRVLTATPHTMN